MKPKTVVKTQNELADPLLFCVKCLPYGKLRLLYLIGSLSIEYNKPFIYVQIFNNEIQL